MSFYQYSSIEHVLNYKLYLNSTDLIYFRDVLYPIYKELKKIRAEEKWSK